MNPEVSLKIMSLVAVTFGALSMVVLSFFAWVDFRWLPGGEQLFHVHGTDVHGVTAADGLVVAALGLSIMALVPLAGRTPTRLAPLGIVAAGLATLAISAYDAFKEWQGNAPLSGPSSDILVEAHGDPAAALYATVVLAIIVSLTAGVLLGLQPGSGEVVSHETLPNKASEAFHS